MERGIRALTIVWMLGLCLVAGPLGAAETYKIGAALPLTGPAQFLGEAEREAMNMAIDQINGQGGVNGQQLEVLYVDTKADVNTAISVVEKFINRDRVPVIITTDSNSAVGTMDITERAKVIHLSVARADVFTAKGYRYCFRNQPTNQMLMEQYMRDLVEQLGTKKLAILVANYPYGLSALDGLKKARLASIEIVYENHFPMETADFTPYLTAIKGSGADTLVLICVERHAIGVVSVSGNWGWIRAGSGWPVTIMWWKRRCWMRWVKRPTECLPSSCTIAPSTRPPRISTRLSAPSTARSPAASCMRLGTRTSMPSTTG